MGALPRGRSRPSWEARSWPPGDVVAHYPPRPTVVNQPEGREPTYESLGRLVEAAKDRDADGVARHVRHDGGQLPHGAGRPSGRSPGQSDAGRVV